MTCEWHGVWVKIINGIGFLLGVNKHNMCLYLPIVTNPPRPSSCSWIVSDCAGLELSILWLRGALHSLPQRPNAARNLETAANITVLWIPQKNKAKTPTRGLDGLRMYLKLELILKCLDRGLCRDPELLPLWTGLKRPPPRPWNMREPLTTRCR